SRSSGSTSMRCATPWSRLWRQVGTRPRAASPWSLTWTPTVTDRRRRASGTSSEDAEALFLGDGDHFGVARGVAIGGGQRHVVAIGRAQTAHLFLAPAVLA